MRRTGFILRPPVYEECALTLNSIQYIGAHFRLNIGFLLEISHAGWDMNKGWSGLAIPGLKKGRMCCSTTPALTRWNKSDSIMAKNGPQSVGRYWEGMNISPPPNTSLGGFLQQPGILQVRSKVGGCCVEGMLSPLPHFLPWVKSHHRLGVLLDLLDKQLAVVARSDF